MDTYTDPAKTQEELTAEWLDRRLARGLRMDYDHPLRDEMEKMANLPRMLKAVKSMMKTHGMCKPDNTP